MICISESYLDSSISPDSEQLNIESHKLIGNDHPGNVRTRGVCAYFRDSLPIRFISKSHLNECLILEVSVSNEKGYAVSLYRSPSQTFDEFEVFLSNLEKLIFNSSSVHSDFVLLIGNFNVRSRNWSNHDLTITEVEQLDSLLTSFSMKQLITEPTHTLENASSCIYLIFTNQPNIVLHSRVHLSLQPKCHHQIIYSQLNLKKLSILHRILVKFG